MKKEQTDNIQEAAVAFGHAIHEEIGEDCKVGVFYIYVDGEDWVIGSGGNMSWLEQYGALKYMLDTRQRGEI